MPPRNQAPAGCSFPLLAVAVSVIPRCHGPDQQPRAHPPEGWNDWNSYGCGISESAVTNTANVIAANGMKAAGYQFVNIDDGRASSRNSNRVVQAYSISGKFPDGIQWLADQVHSQELKLGIYTDDGTNRVTISNTDLSNS